MKKVIALVLSMALLLGMASAFAAELNIDLGTQVFNCSKSEFAQMFAMLSENSGYTFEWGDDEVVSSSYVKYNAYSSDGLLNITLHDMDGISAFEAYAIIDITDVDTAQKIGEWLGAAMASAGYTLYYYDHGELTNEIITASMNEITDLAGFITNINVYTEAQLTEGVAYVGTMCGYPAGIEMQLYTEGNDSWMYVGYFTVPMDSVLTVG